MIYYRQVTVERKTADKKVVSQTTYIPVKFAVVGQVLKLKDPLSGQWVNGWKVVAVYNLTSEKSVLDYRKAIRNHRKNTGDSLPKATANG